MASDVAVPKLPPQVVAHDTFNLIFTALILSFDVMHVLFFTSSFQSILFALLYWTFVGVTFIDTLWISLDGSIVIAERQAILAHHILTLIFCVVPFMEPQFAWLFSLLLLVELNTFLIVLRRKFSRSSIMFRIMQTLFYATWVLFRLIGFPIFTYLFYLEYKKYAEVSGEVINIVLLAPIIQTLLTLLGFKWTMELLMKPSSQKIKSV